MDKKTFLLVSAEELRTEELRTEIFLERILGTFWHDSTRCKTVIQDLNSTVVLLLISYKVKGISKEGKMHIKYKAFKVKGFKV